MRNITFKGPANSVIMCSWQYKPRSEYEDCLIYFLSFIILEFWITKNLAKQNHLAKQTPTCHHLHLLSSVVTHNLILVHDLNGEDSNKPSRTVWEQHFLFGSCQLNLNQFNPVESVIWYYPVSSGIWYPGIFSIWWKSLSGTFLIQNCMSFEMWFQVIKNPVSDHLPLGCAKIATSFQANEVVDPKDLVPSDQPIVFVVGAMAHGSVRKHSIIYSQFKISSSSSPFILKTSLSSQVWDVFQ